MNYACLKFYLLIPVIWCCWQLFDCCWSFSFCRLLGLPHSVFNLLPYLQKRVSCLREKAYALSRTVTRYSSQLSACLQFAQRSSATANVWSNAMLNELKSRGRFATKLQAYFIEPTNVFFEVTWSVINNCGVKRQSPKARFGDTRSNINAIMWIVDYTWIAMVIWLLYRVRLSTKKTNCNFITLTR